RSDERVGLLRMVELHSQRALFGRFGDRFFPRHHSLNQNGALSARVPPATPSVRSTAANATTASCAARNAFAAAHSVAAAARTAHRADPPNRVAPARRAAASRQSTIDFAATTRAPRARPFPKM